MNEKIQKIIDIEWEMFQQVDNIGGRADCQDDKETFYIMRRSQYEDSVKVFSQKQIWPFGSRQSTGYDIRQQIILCF